MNYQYRSFKCVLLIVFGWLLNFPLSLQAHPYASEITNSGGSVHFILNEAADDVKVIFDGGTATNDLGATASGAHVFSLGGHSTYSIIVTKAALGSPTQISTDGTLNDFFGRSAVTVNRNPGTHNFGRVYVASAANGTDSVRSTLRGVYVLNSDGSDALGYGATQHPTLGTGAGQIQYGSSTNYGPYKISIGPDDMVYVADGSGSLGTGPTVGGGVWMVDPDVTNATDLFAFNGTTTGLGLVCVAGTPVITGSVATSNLVIYMPEWNRVPYNNIWKYSMGSGPFPWTNAPVQLASEGISNVNMVTLDFAIAPDGKFFASENRASATGGNVSLRVFDTDGLTLLWDSSTAGNGTDPFVNTYSMAVSPDEKYLAMGLISGNINICKLTNGIPDISSLYAIAGGFGGPCRCVAWDAADNIYGESGGASADDHVRVFSLGLASTAITGNDATGTNGTFQFNPPSNLPVISGPSPAGQAVFAGLPATFTASANGPTPFTYHWQFNGSNLTDNAQISGSLTNSITITGSQTNNQGAYRLIVGNSFGAVTSGAVTLTVNIPGSQTSPAWYQFPNSPGPSTGRHDDIYFTDPTNGWATQNNNIYRTTNGGVTWTTNLVLAGTHFRSIGFATPLIGFAGNLGKGSYDSGTSNTNILYRTIDGGVTWSNVPGFAEAGMQGLCSIYVLDSQHIYGGGRVRGTNAFVIKSADGGFTWNIVNLSAQGVMNGIMDIYFKDTNNGWVCGMDTNSFYTPPYYGRVARTTNGGTTWTTVFTTPISTSYFWKFAWPSANIGYVALQQNAASFDNVVYYKTVDGGNTWASNAIPMSSIGLTTSGFYLQGIGFVSTNEGWLGGASTTSFNNNFLHTTDGGATWSTVGFSDTHAINRIRFMSPTLGFAAGGNTYIYTAPLSITTQPQSQVVVAGTNVNLNVTAQSIFSSPLSYQWLKDGVSTAGATNSSYTLNNITRLGTGTYSVIITNSLAGVQSTNAVVRVIVPERLDSPVLLPGGQLRLTFTDADGGNLITTNDLATFEVLVSTNLTNWSILTNALSITNGNVLLQDTWTNSPKRFYRILEH